MPLMFTPENCKNLYYNLTKCIEKQQVFVNDCDVHDFLKEGWTIADEEIKEEKKDAKSGSRRTTKSMG